MATKNTYGNSGNRWWIGLNVGETGGQSTIFGQPSSIFVGKPSGYESLPSGNAADDAQFAAAAKKDAVSGATPVTISVENVQWYNINGPYSTQVLANAAIPAIQKAHPAPGEVAQAASNTGLPNPLAWEQSLEGVLSNLTNLNLWIRIAKVAIGGTILIVGLAKLTGADQKAGSVAAKAVRIAPLL
jgi:hypothetical protein